QQVLREDKPVIGAVVRQLIPTLVGATDPRCQVNIMTGLTTICDTHADNYPAVVQALKQIDTKKNEALALPAVAFLENAIAAKVEGAKTLKERFAQASPMAAALSAAKGKGRGTRNN